MATAALSGNNGGGRTNRSIFADAPQEADGRLWRTVPSRRWYSQQRGKTPGSQEVVLIHQKRPDSNTFAVTPGLRHASAACRRSPTRLVLRRTTK